MTRGMKLIRLALLGPAAALALAVAPAVQAKASGTKFPYVYNDGDGSKTVIPSRPTRVVVIANMDDVSGLGAHVVGTPENSQSHAAAGSGGGNAQGLPAWLNGGELKGVTPIGGYTSLDYEKIAELRPDLIIGGVASSQVSELSAIAPTITPCCANVATPHFWFEDTLLDLAPIFNATAQVHEIIARMHQRITAVAPFVRGTSVSILEPLAGTQNYLFNGIDPTTGQEGPLTDFFAIAGAKLEGADGAPADNEFQTESTEDLPEATASKVLAITFFNTQPEAAFKADPLYPEIPAVKTGQIYFTAWQAVGTVGTADYITQLSKEMFGVTPLEALLADSGDHSTNRSGVADIDISPTQKRACWDITTSTDVGHPKTADIINKHGTRLLALGKHYTATGCTNISPASDSSLIRSPRSYRVSINTTHTPKILLGSLTPDSPAFAGNGKDRQYNQ
jgi:ABC-type Fe3+-hydroxamate transport system substrate-binding protein